MDLKNLLMKALKMVTSSRQNLVMLVLGILIIFFGSYAMTGYLVADSPDGQENPSAGFTSFTDTGEEICTIDGKPVIRMYSTTTCPHCKWIAETFDELAMEYMDRGDIVAMHWELDARDDSLTQQRENNIPQEEIDLFLRNSGGGGVPTYVMGCRYARLGNAHEGSGGIPAEEAEFRAIIEHLIGESAN